MCRRRMCWRRRGAWARQVAARRRRAERGSALARRLRVRGTASHGTTPAGAREGVAERVGAVGRRRRRRAQLLGLGCGVGPGRVWLAAAARVARREPQPQVRRRRPSRPVSRPLKTCVASASLVPSRRVLCRIAVTSGVARRGRREASSRPTRVLSRIPIASRPARPAPAAPPAPIALHVALALPPLTPRRQCRACRHAARRVRRAAAA